MISTQNNTKPVQIKPPKFLHVAYHVHQQLFQGGMMISGFYNWHLAFNGEFNYFPVVKEKLHEYDIIFVGISAPELNGAIISKLRRELPKDWKGALVACVDYAVEMWQGTFNITHLECELAQADFIFAAELSMVSHLKALLPEREIFHILHPTKTDEIKAHLKPYEQRRDMLLSVIHRYDNNATDLYLATKNIPEKKVDNFALMLDHSLEIQLLEKFKYTKKADAFNLFIPFLSETKIVADSYHRIHSYGRIPIECACLKVPCVGTTNVTSQQILWPDITVNAGDVYGQQKMIEKLLDEPDFYKEVCEKAFERVEMVNYQNSFMSMLKMIGDKIALKTSDGKEIKVSQLTQGDPNAN